MKEKIKELTIPEATAEQRDSIDAENNADMGNPQTGEKENSSDAGNEKEIGAEFEKLISGKYKKQFEKKVQKIIDRRLREVKMLKETADKNKTIVDMLFEKYNITDDDTEKLEKILSQESNAVQKNTDNNDSEMLRRLIYENAYLKRMREKEAANQRAKNRADIWRREAEQTKKEYPDFDFEQQLKNEEFCRLIKAGVNVKHAYEVTNIDAILENNSKAAEKKVVNSIRSKGARPVENGSSPTSGILISSNISNLSKKDREEIARRAARGERITF